MPRLETAKRISFIRNSGANTIGQIHKSNSDLAMELTWDNDIQSKVCYIYDFFHDDQPWLNKGMTYENTTKTKIDAKFIKTKYSSVDKDQVEYHLQFRPSQKVSFDEKDELYYFETDYKNRYDITFPIGMFVDLPDNKNIYHKWLIVDKEEDNQFEKYSILPCEYYLTWIEQNGHNRIKRKMWVVLRMQNSYNSGKWAGYQTTTVENQDKIWLPLNSITEKIGYTNYYGDKTNQRLIVSAPVDNPNTWEITKVENTQPIGIQKITIYQDHFNPHRDYIERDENNKIIAMWADYFSSNVEPTLNDPPPLTSDVNCVITSSTQSVKVGGSYKLLTVRLYNKDGNDITSDYSSIPLNWSYTIDGQDASQIITELSQSEFNKIKIKFTGDRKYLGKILLVRCEISNTISETKLSVTV